MECRTCLKVTEELQDLFTEDYDLPHKIETISALQILESDHFPSKICYSCVRNVHLLYDFRGIIQRSNLILENRAHSARNEETDDSRNNAEALIKSELVQIDEIKMEFQTEILDLNELGNIDEGAKESRTVENEKVNQVRAAEKNNIYECSQCDFSTPHFNFLRTHRKRHKDNQELRSVCSFCGESITIDYLRKHLSNHTETPVTCNICGKVVKHERLLRHMYMHKGISLQCTYCEKIFNNRQSYHKHLQRHNINCPKMEKANMKEKFYKCLSDKPQKSNSFQIPTEKYQKLIEEVTTAKSGDKKENRYYWLLRHYDVVTVNGREQLVVPSLDDEVLRYIAHEELFDVLYETHTSIGHRGRDKMRKELQQLYKNITLHDIQTFLNLCEPCLQKRQNQGFVGIPPKVSKVLNIGEVGLSGKER